MKKGSKAAAAILAKLGASNFLVQDDLTPVPPKDAVIEQGSDRKQNIGPTSSLPRGIQTGNVAPLNTASLETPGVNPAFFNAATMNQGVADNTGLTSSEHAFLDDQEKMMRLRQRGMA